MKIEVRHEDGSITTHEADNPYHAHHIIIGCHLFCDENGDNDVVGAECREIGAYAEVKDGKLDFHITDEDFQRCVDELMEEEE